ncbi:saccharopine dehydrogenase family protein [Actinomadura luteofluorescens]|uniref:saccharopine dehydrogenase family protein n=1 Tax=Actinomadura luteofluorescens TaxID=46163 RepID=UPI003476748A
MRLAVLGGAGHMGRSAVAAALELPFIEHLVIADRDGQGARQVAASSGSDRTRPAQVDVTDRHQLSGLLTECDAVISTVGPFYRFGATILEAALAAGCHYVDICDDPGPTLQLLEYDETARKAGLTAIVGAGASPGISNLLAIRAMENLTAIDTLITGWGTGGRQDNDQSHPDSVTAAIEHWVEQLTGPIPIQDNGRQEQGRPLQPVTVRLPGHRPVTAYTVGHPEPVTLPRYFPSIRRSVNVMDMPLAVMALIEATAEAVNSGRLTVPEAARSLAGALYGGKAGPAGAKGAARALAAAAREQIIGKRYLPQLFALAVGKKEGRTETRAAYLDGTIPGGMGPLTCIPAAIMLSMVADGEIQRHGVFAPEAGVDPDRFFTRLSRHVKHGIISDERGPVRVLIES